MDKKNLKSLRFQRILLSVLCVVLGLVLAVLICGTVYANHLLNQLNYVDPETTLPTLSAEEIAAIENEPEPTLAGFVAPKIEAADVDFGTGPQIQIGGGDIVNILLVGYDLQNGAGHRSDSMILCTFNKTKNTITLTSFMRDLYVEIPGYADNRINAAYTYGGISLLQKTLKHNFGIEVDGSVQVDFYNFKDIINLLGGVTLDLTEAEVKFINKRAVGNPLSVGTNVLNGSQALWYARNRHDVDGDFSRTNRQRKLLNALLDEYKSKKLTEMLVLMGDLLPMVTTDISKSDLTAYAVTLLPMAVEAEIKTQSIPVAGGYKNARIDGKSVLVPDLEKNRQALVDSLT